jgi:GTP-binding protein
MFMIPANSENIRKEYKILLNELEQFNPELTDKARILAITKCDLLDSNSLKKLQKRKMPDIPVVFISSLNGMGIPQMKDEIWKSLQSQ